MVDFSDLNISLCFETIVVKSTFWKLLASYSQVNILEVTGSIIVDLILAVLDNHGTFQC